MCNDNVFDLAEFVDSEIKSKQLIVEEKIPADFPFAIHDKVDPRDKIMIELLSNVFKDNSGRSRGESSDGLTRDHLGLTREFDGERILVKVEMPVQYRYDKHGHGTRKESDRINLIVKIFKKEGKRLTFNVCAAGVITVESVSIEVPADYNKHPRVEEFRVVEDSSLHLGFKEYLKVRGIFMGFKEYLKVRGIDKNTTDFLHKYMLRKPKNQPVIVLKNLKKFLAFAEV